MAKIAYEEHKDDVNLGDNRGHTCLHWASTNNHLHIVEWVLKLPGVNVNAIDKDHLTPLHIASHGGHYKIVRLLLEAGADQHMQVNLHFISFLLSMPPVMVVVQIPPRLYNSI